MEIKLSPIFILPRLYSLKHATFSFLTFLVAQGYRISARECLCYECTRSKVPNPKSPPVPVTFIQISYEF